MLEKEKKEQLATKRIVMICTKTNAIFLCFFKFMMNKKREKDVRWHGMQQKELKMNDDKNKMFPCKYDTNIRQLACLFEK